MSSVVETLFRFIEATSSRRKDWQIASAVALGVLCGLLPYTSLLPAFILAFAFFIPFHASLFLGTAVVAAVSTSSIQYLFAPVGEWTLSFPIVLNQVLKVNALPLGSWLRLNNTVVNGALVIGLVQFIPTYATVRTFCYLFRPSRQRTDPDFQRGNAQYLVYRCRLRDISGSGRHTGIQS